MEELIKTILSVYEPFISLGWKMGMALIMYGAIDKTFPFNLVRRKHEPLNMSKVVLPPKLATVQSEIDEKHLVEKCYSDQITRFIEVITKKFPQKDLTNFSKNINSLRVHRKYFFIQDCLGYYTTANNTMTIDKRREQDRDFDETIFHELFHMISATIDNGIFYTGFKFYAQDTEAYGYGINEGYTELLTLRYFTNKLNGSYYYFTTLVEGIEKIVGKDKMESLYLNSNLRGLIDELKKYAPEDKVMRLIEDSDYICRCEEKGGGDFEKIKQCITRNCYFLLLAYFNKVLKENDNAKEIDEKMKNYVNTLLIKWQNWAMFIPEIREHLIKITRDIYTKNKEIWSSTKEYIEKKEILYRAKKDIEDKDFVPTGSQEMGK